METFDRCFIRGDTLKSFALRSLMIREISFNFSAKVPNWWLFHRFGVKITVEAKRIFISDPFRSDPVLFDEMTTSRTRFLAHWRIGQRATDTGLRRQWTFVYAGTRDVIVRGARTTENESTHRPENYMNEDSFAGAPSEQNIFWKK